MAGIPVQFSSTPGDVGGGTSQQCTLSNVTVNNDIIVATFTTGTAAIAGIADGANTYTKLASVTGTAGTGELWITENVAAAVSLTITATWASSTAYQSITVLEEANLVTTPLDTSTTNSGASGITISGTSLTSAATFETQFALVIGAGKPFTGIGPTSTSWAPLTTSAMHTLGFGLAAIFDTSATANQITWDQTASAAWVVLQIALKTNVVSNVIDITAENTPGTVDFAMILPLLIPTVIDIINQSGPGSIDFLTDVLSSSITTIEIPVIPIAPNPLSEFLVLALSSPSAGSAPGQFWPPSFVIH